MILYCLKCEKDTEHPRVSTSKGVIIEQWYYQNVQNVAVKKSRFTKNQEAKRLLSNLGIRTPLTKVPMF